VRPQLLQQRVEDLATPQQEVALEGVQQPRQAALDCEIAPQKRRGVALHPIHGALQRVHARRVKRQLHLQRLELGRQVAQSPLHALHR